MPLKLLSSQIRVIRTAFQSKTSNGEDTTAKQPPMDYILQRQ